MAAIRDHWSRIKEHLEEIEDAIAIGIERRPATIGLHASACIMELLELYLHKLGKIPVGKVLKHDWFKRPQAGQKVPPLVERKLAVDFPEKERIYELIYDIEDNRNSLVYGRVTKSQIELVIKAFNELKHIILKRLEELGEHG